MTVIVDPRQDGARLHHTTQNGTQSKIYELFISGIFHLIFSDYGWLQVTETVESETADKGGAQYDFYFFKTLL